MHSEAINGSSDGGQLSADSSIIDKWRNVYMYMSIGHGFLFFYFLRVLPYPTVCMCICNSTGRSEIWDKFHEL